MGDGEKLSFAEFLGDVQSVITSPARRFALIRERGAVWGSLALLLVPVYFGFYYMGGIYFDRDPFPGYSFFPPLAAAIAAVFLKLYFIHLFARMFRPRESAVPGRSGFSGIVVVYGYTDVPALVALLLALALFLLIPQEIGYLMRTFKAVTFSIMAAIGIVLFVWNLILKVLALRTVYAIRDFKIVIALLLGSVVMMLPASATLWIAAQAKVDFAYVQPILAPKILRLFASDPTSTMAPTTKYDVHIDRIAYRFRSPQRFELVAYLPKQPKSQESRHRGAIVVGVRSIFSWDEEGCVTGRIVGLPGDEVEVVGGVLRVNGQAWDERYLTPEYRSDISLPPRVLGPAEYYILPENRRLLNEMKDELVVSRDQIVGRQIISRWPLGWWGLNPAVFLQAVPVSQGQTR
jgi:hypothetical protein